MFYKLTADREVVEAKASDRFPSIEQRKVAVDTVGPFRISTVFLGVEHGRDEFGRPIVFETMIFHGDGWLEEYYERYATWADAEARHGYIVQTMRDWTQEGRLIEQRVLELNVGH